jgi:uncharacterized protein (TIGR00251 family)
MQVQITDFHFFIYSHVSYMIEVAPHTAGCILAVRGQPGARRSGIVGEHGGALKIAVTAPAEQGKANKAILELLAEVLELKGSQLELLSGGAARDKRVLIRGLTPAEVQARIAPWL